VLFRSHQYLNIGSYFQTLGLRKLAAMFFKQGDEERAHGVKFIHYLDEVGGEVEIPAVKAPKSSFKSVEEAVQISLDWELEVTRRINAMMALAIELKDYAAQDFLRWFVTEQVEEVSTMDNLLKVVKAAGDRSLLVVEAYLVHNG
jgi:ferritin